LAYHFNIIVGQHIFFTSVNAAEYHRKEWILDASFLKCHIYPVRHAFEFIKIYISNVETRLVYDHVGIREVNNKKVYLHGGGAIGTNENIICNKNLVIETDTNMGASQAFYEVLDMINIGKKTWKLPRKNR